jgi:hypothetical protein
MAMGLALLLLGPPVMAQDKPKERPQPEKDKQPPTPAEQFKAVVSQYDKAMTSFYAEYSKAKNDAERQKVFDAKYPKTDKPAKQCLELAQQNPKTGFAVDALVWVIQHDRGPNANRALSILMHDHLESPKLVAVARFLTYSGMPAAPELLGTLLDKSPDKNVKGMACFGLAQVHKGRAEMEGASDARRAEEYKEAEKYCNRIEAEFADVKSYRPLGQLAKGELFEIQHLAIGQTAPTITGEDLDGKKFSLLDYRGKVVVLDFWGNW